MEICNPGSRQIPGLRALWKEAFGDSDAFLDIFFGTAFHESRCRCFAAGEDVAAALYWFDCTLGDARYAYIYAVATAKAHRGKGLCHALMADTHALLKSNGYAGALLVPQEESLREFYATMDYRNAGGSKTFSRTASGAPVPLRVIGPEEFALRRRRCLPEGGLIQEGENLLYLQHLARFYAGDDFLLTAWEDSGTLHAEEFLGDCNLIPGILTALNCSQGHFRTPGEEPFAMFLPLSAGAQVPEYLGFCFA